MGQSNNEKFTGGVLTLSECEKLSQQLGGRTEALPEYCRTLMEKTTHHAARVSKPSNIQVFDSQTQIIDEF